MLDNLEDLWLEYNRSIYSLKTIMDRTKGLIASILIEDYAEDRGARLERAKMAFHEGYIATRLIEDGAEVGESRIQAASILRKSGFNTAAPNADRRTVYEERLYGNSRQQWSAMLKSIQEGSS